MPNESQSVVPNETSGSSEAKPQDPIGTAAYDNWRAFESGAPRIMEFEHPLYTDARVTGEVTDGLGPYAFINLVPLIQNNRRAQAAVVLRWSVHVLLDSSKMLKTDQKRYHGGSSTEEVAALASLRCGIRLRSDGPSRRFEPKGDPRGIPVAWSSGPPPSFDLGSGPLMLPSAAGEHSIMPVADMRSFPKLKPEQAIALVRSARLYQDALWLGESEPNLCWLMLVGAVETAANCWRAGSDPPFDRLVASDPDFVEYLKQTGVEGIAGRVAEKFAGTIGATKKFIEFLLTFLPNPPEHRPASWAQVEWTHDNLERGLRKVYSHRSNALHNAMPFPAPICAPPARYEVSWTAVSERPGMLAASQGGGTWLATDLPMHLHIFEYIARNAINSWWSFLV
jgi:hypothetical protein